MRIIKSLALGVGAALAAARRGKAISPRPRLVLVADPRKGKSSAPPRDPDTSQLGWSGLIHRTINQFLDDDCLTMGAALAYYTTFSIAPLLLIVISLAGLFLGRTAVMENLVEQVTSLVGADAATQITTMLQRANVHRAGVVGAVVGVFFVLAGATGAFVQSQEALNRAWQIKPDPKKRKGALMTFIMKRLLSLGMILGIGFLLLVSLLLGAALSGINTWFEGSLPAALSSEITRLLELIISFGLITVLFAALFRVLPDTYVPWCDVWVGAGLTAFLFTIGKYLIGLYLGKSSLASAYGAAGSFVVILVWTYYASLIVLMGAEFTQVWVEHGGRAKICREDSRRPTDA